MKLQVQKSNNVEILELPKEWRTVKLSDLGVINDGDWILAKHYTKEGVRLIQIGDIGQGRFLDKSQKYVSKETAIVLKCSIVNPGKDILISRMPEPVGRACLSPILSYDYIVAVDISILSSDIKIIDNTFLVYLLNFENTLNQVQQFISGSTRQRISRKNLEEITLSIPPLKEQKKIASILSNVDNLIQKTHQIIEQTQRLKTGLMQRLLTKGIGHTKFKDIVLGLNFLKLNIPVNWNVEKLKDLVKIIDTPHYTSPYFDFGIPVIRTSDCTRHGINYENTKFTSEEEYQLRRKIIDPDIGDVLYTREAPPGIASNVDRKKISVGQRIVLLKPNSNIVGNFLSLFLNSPFGALQANSMTLKTTVEHVNIEDIREFRIALPPVEEQQKITYIISNVDILIQKIKAKKKNEEFIKKGLMHQLLTGKRRVKA